MIIPVDLGNRSYSIVVEPGALAGVGRRLRELRVGSRAVLVTDAGILKLHGAAVITGLEAAGLSVTVLEVPEGGGAVGDLAGFVAATYMRGANFVPLPTTVLGQVDASIGGKTAIDHPKAKNLIGAFYQPRLVVVDPAVALTLPERDFRSGLAEIVKHGVVLDAAYFDDVERSARELSARDLPTLTRIIGGSCRLKAGVIQRDPEETGEWRFALNYGHTIGHALEAATRFETWTHGEAVSLGIVAEARLAERLGLAAPETTRRQESLLHTLGLPVRAATVDPDAVLAAIAHDKKARDGRVPFVLAPSIGAFRVVYDVPLRDVRAALESIVEGLR
jgi:3-dehydroquinate synthase